MRKYSRGVTGQAKRALGAAAVAGVAGLGLASAAHADDLAVAAAAVTEVTGVDIVGAQAKPSSPKYVEPLADTPQTITVITGQTVREQNLLTLREILSTVPGITFGAGEGGGGYGDSINLRGYAGSNDLTSDGLRDSAQYTRSDPFNLDSIEVVNGANSVYSGAGSVGGTINLVSKTPAGSDRTTISAGIGTEEYGRLTVDTDQMIAPGVAVRLNVMAHRNDAPGRDVETFERWGIAPSIAFGVGSPTKLTLSWFHQSDDNIPQYGVPYASNAFLNGPLPGVDPSNYYGYRNIDRQEIGVDTLTARFEHAFGEQVSVSNITRWQEVTQLTIVNPPQGAWCLASGFNAQTGAACGTPGLYGLSGPRGNLRDTRNTLLVNQTDLTFTFATGPLAHTLVAGLSAASEDYHLISANVQRTAGGATPAYPAMNIAAPDNLYAGPVNFTLTSVSDGALTNRALYVFDNVDIGERWQVNGGVRVERNEGRFAVSTTPGAARNAEDLVSWRLGLVFKPAATASYYLAYSNAQTPSQATVNGGCTLATGTTGAANCDVDPEEAVNYEVGGKWELLDRRLLLTASLFRNERNKYRVPSGVVGVDQVLDGKSRVTGLALGASGLITDDWAVFANYTWLDSELLQGVSAFCLANPALPSCASAPLPGDPLPNTPEHAFNVWTTYDLNDDFQIGYGAGYSGEYAFARASGATRLFHAPSYWLHSASVTWHATKAIDLQLNVKNILDEAYYNRIRSSNGFGWATPGDTRSASLTVHYRF